MLDVNWISVGFAVLGAVVTIAIAGAGALIAWGRICRTVEEHGEHQKKQNGRIESQAEKESSLQAEIESMKSRVKATDNLFRRNNEDHIELFARINQLEKGQAALPGQMAQMMDDKFKQWRKDIKSDIKATIYEIDREKERKG